MPGIPIVRYVCPQELPRPLRDSRIEPPVRAAATKGVDVMGTTSDNRLLRIAVIGAVAVGVGAGGYGIAAAAGGGSGAGSSSGTTTDPNGASQVPHGGAPWGHARTDETALTGATAARVEAAAEAEVPGGTVVRVETDADGHAAYEAHMTKADGTPVTVYVDKQFEVVEVESR
jgi:hypothetical protein